MNTKPNLPYYLHKTANTLYRWKIPVLPFCIKQFMRIALGAVIPYEAKIGENVHFGFNGLGIVIHRKCIIGSNVHIFHQVTIAGGRGGTPRIGDNVVIGSGAKIIGAVNIGDYARIGANAVVLEDIPSNCTAVGVPARIVKRPSSVKL